MGIMIRKLITFTATSLAVSAVAQASGEEYNFNIGRQPLVDALLQFSQQSGLQISYVRQAPNEPLLVGPLIGRYTPDGAIRELLMMSNLSFTRLNERTIAVTPPVAKERRLQNGASFLKPPEQMHQTTGVFMRLASASSPEAAEETGQPAAGPAENKGGGEKQVEEVIVTATKRSERIQDIPLSITAIGASEIDQRGLVNAADYLRSIPGVAQADGFQGQAIVIRGMESVTRDQNFGSGPTTATYFGETPTTNSSGIQGGSNVDLKLVDIERVEVLRGPQGTAFGNSSMGGAVRTIPMAPKLDRFEGKVSAGYSATSGAGDANHNIQGVANLPLIDDKLAIRAVGYRYDESGFYTNRAASDPAFRASFVTPFGAQGFVADKDEAGANATTGGRIAARFRATDDLQLTLSYLRQTTETDGIPLATSGTYEQTLPQVAPEHVIRGQRGGVFDNDIDIANAVLDYNLGWGSLVATYSYTDSGSELSFPFSAYGPLWAVSTVSTSPHREHVGEVRLATQLDGPWNFLAGVYYEDLKDTATAQYLWFGNPATNFLDPTGFYDPARRLLGDRSDARNLKQKAIYGEATWEFVENWALTAGVRSYEYDRTHRADGIGAFYGRNGLHEQSDTEVSDENFRANLSYKPTADAHLYASWSQGFRLGRPQGGLPSVCDGNGDGIADVVGIPLSATRVVNPDSVDSYELGGKFALMDRRVTVDTAVFRMEWSGVPFRVAGGTGCPFSFNTNAGDAQSEGAEIQVSFQLAESLRMDLGGAWVRARLQDDVRVGPSSLGFKDDRLPGTPEVNANLGLQYTFEIGEYTALVRADSSYVGSFYDNLAESPNADAGDYVKVDTTARISAGMFNIDLFVRNLTNEDAFTSRVTNAYTQFYGYRMRPRTIGLQLGYSF